MPVPARSVSVSLSARPSLVHAGISRHPGGVEDYRVSAHTLHLYAWRGRIDCAGSSLPVRFGHVGFHPPGLHTVYHYEDRSCEHIYFHFQPRGQGGEPFPAMADWAPHYAELRESMEHILRLIPVNRERAELRLWDLLLELRDLHASRDPERPRAHPGVRKAMELIEKSLHDPLPTPRLARETGFSQTHLNRLFRVACGKSLKSYALSRRMERARYLLRHTDFPVRQVAAECGLFDLQQFNKLCRRHLGLSPRSIRGRP
ncbi:MAG: helix-turn-helix transcriptional regulator [Spirochaetes bacterium]|nr:helix-turn-helix transcriptional regulator [Spirochaetota bacterium]